MTDRDAETAAAKLDTLLARWRAKWDAMSPEEREAEVEAGRRAYVAAEMAMGDDGRGRNLVWLAAMNATQDMAIAAAVKAERERIALAVENEAGERLRVFVETGLREQWVAGQFARALATRIRQGD